MYEFVMFYRKEVYPIQPVIATVHQLVQKGETKWNDRFEACLLNDLLASRWYQSVE